VTLDADGEAKGFQLWGWQLPASVLWMPKLPCDLDAEM
jgi:hypothetical protein